MFNLGGFVFGSSYMANKSEGKQQKRECWRWEAASQLSDFTGCEFFHVIANVWLCPHGFRTVPALKMLQPLQAKFWQLPFHWLRNRSLMLWHEMLADGWKNAGCLVWADVWLEKHLSLHKWSYTVNFVIIIMTSACQALCSGSYKTAWPYC